LKNFVPEYTGPDKDCDHSALFIQHKFHEIAADHNPNKEIYSHFTTATDTSNIQDVFRLVLETIIRENLRQTTLI
jgi:hypothetical protein